MSSSLYPQISTHIFFSLTHREFEGKGQSSYIPHIHSLHTVFIIINILH